MNSDSNNYEDIYCIEDDECRVCCEICDKLCIEREYKYFLNSGTQTNFFYKSHRINISTTNF